MPRGSNGTYTLPAGNPVVSGEVIQSSWANPTMTDIGNELTNSLDRYGRGGMLAPFKFIDGTAGAPSITFTNDPVLGIYRALQGDMRFVVDGADVFRVIAGKSQTWSGTAFADVVFQGGSPTFAAIGVTLGILLNNDTPIEAKTAAGVAHDVLWVNAADQFNIGTSALASYLHSSVNPVWYDGTNNYLLATQSWVQSWVQNQSYAPLGADVSFNSVVAGVLNATTYVQTAADTSGTAGYKIGTESFLRLMSGGEWGVGNVARTGLIYSANQPYWNNGTTTKTLATTDQIGGSGAQLDVAQSWTALQTFLNGITVGSSSAPAAPGSSANFWGQVFRVNAQLIYLLPSDGTQSSTLVYGSLSNSQRIYIGSRAGRIAYGDTRNSCELDSATNPVWYNGTTETPLAAVMAVALVNADGTVVKQRGFASITHTGTGQYAVTYPDYAGQGTLVALQRGTDGVRVVGVGGASSGTIETWVGAVKSDQPFLVMLLAI